MRRALCATMLALLILSGCASTGPTLTSPKIDVDTPALRAIKKDAGIEACPIADAELVHNVLPDAVVPCLGGGRSVNLARLRGPLIINLWAQFCGPCRKEMPVLQKFYEQFGFEVPVIGIDYTDPQPELALQLAKKTGARYPMVADYDNNIRVVGLPTTIMIDETGKVVYNHGGRVGSVVELRALVAKYLGVVM
ncbi:MAG TPA: redoxin domain-containing protein [Marmoricola sp.]